jgi:hypothetical protein
LERKKIDSFDCSNHKPLSLLILLFKPSWCIISGETPPHCSLNEDQLGLSEIVYP